MLVLFLSEILTSKTFKILSLKSQNFPQSNVYIFFIPRDPSVCSKFILSILSLFAAIALGSSSVISNGSI